MSTYVDDFDAIDAAVFSGDMLENYETRRLFKEYCERWLRAITEHECLPVAGDNDEFFNDCDREGEEK